MQPILKQYLIDLISRLRLELKFLKAFASDGGSE